MYASLQVRKRDGSRRSDLIQAIGSNRTITDVIAGMLSYMGEDKFPANANLIHSAIFHIQEDHSELLEGLTFSRGDLYPFSRQLERVLFQLQNSGIISTLNPGFKQCEIPSGTKEYLVKEILPLFTADEQEELQLMANEFEKKIGAE
jgi:hypothetical protein